MSTVIGKAEIPSVTIIGKTDIPNPKDGILAPISDARKIIDSLEPGLATVVELGTIKQRKHLQSMLHLVASLKFGKRGLIETKSLGNVIYVWLTHPEES